jgi:hypothetical protein
MVDDVTASRLALLLVIGWRFAIRCQPELIISLSPIGP